MAGTDGGGLRQSSSGHESAATWAAGQMNAEPEARAGEKRLRQALQIPAVDEGPPLSTPGRKHDSTTATIAHDSAPSTTTAAAATRDSAHTLAAGLRARPLLWSRLSKLQLQRNPPSAMVVMRRRRMAASRTTHSDIPSTLSPHTLCDLPRAGVAVNRWAHAAADEAREPLSQACGEETDEGVLSRLRICQGFRLPFDTGLRWSL
ncbi:hypothetical protein K438DRAFT_1843459 [Mycena galopus ATCC 62051]|nr:hypothetical protein K438DRAFT_1843459 [Mycena galopus ATCC 62051]